MARNPAHQFGSVQVVVLAGGFGTRLAEHTDEIPKPMVQIGGRPILWHIFKIYGHHGFNDFLVACGYRAELIKRFFLEYRQQRSDLVIDYVHDTIERRNQRIEPWRVGLIDTGTHTMTGGRLKRLREHLDGRTFMMTYGDGLADICIPELLAFHRRHGRLATFTAVHPPARYGAPCLQGSRVIRFEEKPQREDEWINGGFFVLEPGVLDTIESDDTAFEQEPLRQLAADGQLMAYRHHGFWHPMDTLRDVRNLNAMWASGESPWKIWAQPAPVAGATAGSW